VTIYLDMDGVIADFFNAALNWHGGAPLKPVWPRKEYAMASVLGLSAEEFWAPMYHRDFWDEIRPYPGAREFYETLREVGPVEILTVATGDFEVCAEAKRDWCRDVLGANPGTIRVMDSSTSKADYVIQRRHSSLLIDDNLETCLAIHRGGGRVVLVKRPWNTADITVDFDTVDYRTVLKEVEHELTPRTR